MIKSYFASWVRGADGNNATQAAIQANVNWGLLVCQRLRDYLGPEHVVYCPHEHEDLYQRIYQSASPEQKVVISHEVLNQCLSVVDMADVLWLAKDPEFSRGMRTEIERANELGIIIGRLWCCGDWEVEIKRVLDELEDKGLF